MDDQTPYSEADIFRENLPGGLLGFRGEDTFATNNEGLWFLGDNVQFPAERTEFLEPLKNWASSDIQLEPRGSQSGSLAIKERKTAHGEIESGGSRPSTPYLDKLSSSMESVGDELLFLSNSHGLPHLSPQAPFVDITHRSESRPRWLCAECKQQFRTSQDLESHARAEGHRAFVCKECKKGYSRRDTYVRHATTHKPSGFHTCQICLANNKEAVFKRKDHLDQHERNKHPMIPQSMIRRNLRSDRYGIGDDIAPTMVAPSASRASSLSPARWSPISGNHWDKESQDVGFLLNTADLRTDNTKTDHFTIRDNLVPSRSSDASPGSSVSATAWHTSSEVRSQDLKYVLEDILGSPASAQQFIDNPSDLENSTNRAKIVRGLARLALLPPDQLSPQRKQHLSTLVYELEATESTVMP